jgi:hypothetical protein
MSRSNGKSSKARRQFTPDEKATILRRHLVDKVAVSDLCDEYRIDLDGALHGSVVREGMAQPFLCLASDHGDKLAPPDSQVLADIRSASKRDADDKLIVTLQHSHHFSFGDQSLTQSRLLRSVLVRLSGQGAWIRAPVCRQRRARSGSSSMSICAAHRAPRSTRGHSFPGRDSKPNDVADGCRGFRPPSDFE